MEMRKVMKRVHPEEEEPTQHELTQGGVEISKKKKKKMDPGKVGGAGRRWPRGSPPHTAWSFWARVSAVESVLDLVSLSAVSSVNTFRIPAGRDLRRREWKPWAAAT